MLKSMKCGVGAMILILAVSACSTPAKKTKSEVAPSASSQSLFKNKTQNPQLKQPSDKIDVSMQANRADQFYQTGDFVKAESAYQALLKLDQKQPIAYYRLGNIAFRNKQFKRAIFYFNKSLELRPRNDKAQYNLAVTYLSLAEQHFKFYTTMMPEDAYATARLTRILAEIQFFSEDDESTSSSVGQSNEGKDQSFLDELAKELE